jgi:hypothetical protein
LVHIIQFLVEGEFPTGKDRKAHLHALGLNGQQQHWAVVMLVAVYQDEVLGRAGSLDMGWELYVELLAEYTGYSGLVQHVVNEVNVDRLAGMRVGCF